MMHVGLHRATAVVIAAVAVVGAAGCDLQRRREAERALGSQDPSVRVHALRTLADTRAADLLPKIVPLLRDRSARVRRAAVAAVGALGVGDYLHAVLERLHDADLQVRLAAVRVLGDSGQPQARRPLLSVLRDPSMVVRRAAAMALEAIGLDHRQQKIQLASQIVDENLRALEDQRVDVRGQAVARLARGAWPRTAGRLARALGDPADEVVAQAALGLGRIGGERALVALRRAVERKHQGPSAEALRVAVVAGLVRWLAQAGSSERQAPGRRDALALLSRLAGDSDPRVRLATWQQLGAEPALFGAVVGARVAVCQAVESAACEAVSDLSTAAIARAAAGVVDRCVLACAAQARTLARALAEQRRGPGPATGSASRPAGASERGDGVPDEETADAGDPAHRRLAAYGILARIARHLQPADRDGVDRLLQGFARQRLERYRLAAERWLDRAAWARLDDRAARAPSSPAAGKPPPARQRRRALTWLLSRFPRQGVDDPDDPDDPSNDPLLPAAEHADRVASLLLDLGGVRSSHSWLAELALDRTLEPRLREAALVALGSGAGTAGERSSGANTDSDRISDPAAHLARRAVRLGIQDRRQALRRAALSSCSVLGDEAVGRAIELLGDRDFELRSAAASCLGRLGARAAVLPLLELLRRETHLRVIEALSEIGDHRATAPIAALLAEDHAVVRYAERTSIIEALGALADPAAAPALERELGHPEWRVRQAAAQALARAGRPESVQPLELCALDYDVAVRRACTEARQRLGPGSVDRGR